MDESTRRTLEAINRRFYADRAQDFDSSRTRAWQGWSRALVGLPRSGLRVLDLGCGNGRLLAHLVEQGSSFAQLLGVDNCRALIELARERYGSGSSTARFECADLVDRNGVPTLPAGDFDLVALMGVLHHVPSQGARRALVHAAFDRVGAGGKLVLTVWRFEHDSRLSKRTIAWPAAIAGDPLLATLDLGQLEPGDTLLQWNKGARAIRYCHAIAAAEIDRWLEDLPASVERFFADGEGELNEYVVLQR